MIRKRLFRAHVVGCAFGAGYMGLMLACDAGWLVEVLGALMLAWIFDALSRDEEAETA